MNLYLIEIDFNKCGWDQVQAYYVFAHSMEEAVSLMPIEKGYNDVIRETHTCINLGKIFGIHNEVGVFREYVKLG